MFLNKCNTKATLCNLLANYKIYHTEVKQNSSSSYMGTVNMIYLLHTIIHTILLCAEKLDYGQPVHVFFFFLSDQEIIKL